MSAPDPIKELQAKGYCPPGFSRAVGYQMAAHAIGLAMQNAVAQQQHAYVLLNAITTSATRAVLESRAEDAREAIKLAREVLNPAAIAVTLAELKDLLDRLVPQDGTADLSIAPNAMTAAPGKEEAAAKAA
ncbi:MAG TPA: RebB family R body protein [Rhodocyclaceae bacterium]|nr:RebB family R body protein [Rhodocyclaceae bacterium]